MNAKKLLIALFAALSMTTAANAQSASEGWQKVEPTDVKNAVELFNDDWMALAAGRQGDMNAMTISWGGMGELWGKPVVTVYVRQSRYTHSFLERYPYFTLTAFPEEMRSALQYIGTHSGSKEKDKLQKAGLTPAFTELGNPIFKEANLAIECRIVYSAPLAVENMVDDNTKKGYKSNDDLHTMYIAEIVNVWKR